MERKERQKRQNSIQISCLKKKKKKKTKDGKRRKRKSAPTGLRACSTTALLSGSKMLQTKSFQLCRLM
jgi:hypothetical protein